MKFKFFSRTELETAVAASIDVTILLTGAALLLIFFSDDVTFLTYLLPFSAIFIIFCFIAVVETLAHFNIYARIYKLAERFVTFLIGDNR